MGFMRTILIRLVCGLAGWGAGTARLLLRWQRDLRRLARKSPLCM